MSETGRRVPTGRFNRLARLGAIGLESAGSAALKGAGEALRGRRASFRDLMITPRSISQVSRELSRLRGAAMKAGQMLSMDAGDFLPPEFAELTANLRNGADPMAPRQLKQVLEQYWGKGWLKRFEFFNPRPSASASIGQVHQAFLPDGRKVAVKVQHPGIRDSIDSDMENVGTLMRMSGLIPAGLDLEPSLEEARRQLHAEADYLREANNIERYTKVLGRDPRFRLPSVIRELSGPHILVMDWLEGDSIDMAAGQDEAERRRVFDDTLELTFHELLSMRLMQTDPNFANFLYSGPGEPIGLIDFGAVQDIPAELSERYRNVITAGLAGDEAELEFALIALGVLDPEARPGDRDMVLHMAQDVFARLQNPDGFDFGDRSWVKQSSEAGLGLVADGYNHAPPSELMFIQRKLGGLYLLGAKLDLKVELGAMIEAALGRAEANPALKCSA